jgi:hypothetical protein
VLAVSCGDIDVDNTGYEPGNEKTEPETPAEDEETETGIFNGNFLKSLIVDGETADLGIPGMIKNALSDFTGYQGSVTIPTTTDAVIHAVTAGNTATVDWGVSSSYTFDGKYNAILSLSFNLSDISFSTGKVTFPAHSCLLVIRVMVGGEVVHYYVINVTSSNVYNMEISSLTVGGVPATLGTPGAFGDIVTGEDMVTVGLSTFTGIPGAVTVPSLTNVEIKAVTTDITTKVLWCRAASTSLYLSLAFGGMGGAPPSFNATFNYLVVRVDSERGDHQHYVIKVSGP